MRQFGPLISTNQLADQFDDMCVIDGSWRMPGGPHARTDYDRRHIPGAVFFDIDAIADRSTSLPHMLPAPDDFERMLAAMGVCDQDEIVVYDDQGLFSAARVWWTFRAMGHERVAVLDGGLPKWRREGRPLSAKACARPPCQYRARFRADLVADANMVRQALQDENCMIVDARPAERFAGRAGEPRANLRAGAMPGALNLPYQDLINADGTLKSADEIIKHFESIGARAGENIITSCGSGVTAAILTLALDVAGIKRHALYDGSWAEWGDINNSLKEYPVLAEKCSQ